MRGDNREGREMRGDNRELNEIMQSQTTTKTMLCSVAPSTYYVYLPQYKHTHMLYCMCTSYRTA